MRPSKTRSLIYGAISVFGSVLFVLVAAEVVLRFFPVEVSARTMALNAENSVLRAPPNTRFSHSVGWNFRHPNSGRVNNDGFFNDQDYSREGPRPLIAVIGDSYVEAKMVPYEQTIQGRLAKNIGKFGRAYSFALSGAPLSQYLAWSSYARESYAPDAMIVVVVGNDFDESRVKYMIRDGFYHYAEDGDGVLRLRLTEYNPSFWRIFMVESALARYLAFHLRVRESWARLKGKVMAFFRPAGDRNAPRYVGNTQAATSAKRQRHSIAVVDAFFRDLPQRSGLRPERILILLDGLRPSIYEPEKEVAERKSYFAKMRDYVIRTAAEHGYPVIDLHEVFEADYQQNEQRFEFDIDAHWSGYGHGVVARAVMQSAWYATVFGGD